MAKDPWPVSQENWGLPLVGLCEGPLTSLSHKVFIDQWV